MKKIALALLTLVIAFPLVAGDVDDAAVSISGDAAVTWGVDLDSTATGFTNTLNAKLQLNFGLADTVSKSGSEEGAIYGEITIDEIEIKTQKPNNAGEVDPANLIMDIDLESAKIVGENWWVSVKAQDDTIDYENATQNGIFGVADGVGWDGQMDNVKNDIDSSGGFEAGLSIPDIADLEVSLFSLTDWTDTSADKNAYGAKAEVILTAVPNLTVKGAINMGFGAAAATTLNDDMGFGGLLSYEIAVNDDISITPEIGVDIHMLDAGGMDMAIGNGLKITLPGSEVTGAEDVIEDDAGNTYAWDDGVNSGITVGWSYFMPGTTGVDPQLGLQAHVGLSMIENLVVAAGLELTDLQSTVSDTAFAAWLEYTAGNFVPYAGLYMLMDGAATPANEMIAEAGFALNNLFPLTSLYLDWNSGNLQATTADLGILKLKVKVAY